MLKSKCGCGVSMAVQQRTAYSHLSALPVSHHFISRASTLDITANMYVCVLYTEIRSEEYLYIFDYWFTQKIAETLLTLRPSKL